MASAAVGAVDQAPSEGVAALGVNSSIAPVAAPPIATTFPVARAVAVWRERAKAIGPAETIGEAAEPTRLASRTSVEARAAPPPPVPPAIRRSPFPREVTVCSARPAAIENVVVWT